MASYTSLLLVVLASLVACALSATQVSQAPRQARLSRQFSQEKADYSVPDYYTNSYQQPTFIERVGSSIGSFLDPLLKADIGLVALLVGGFILALKFFGFINVGTLIPTVESFLTKAGTVTQSRSGRKLGLLDEKMDRVEAIVRQSLENVKEWIGEDEKNL